MLKPSFLRGEHFPHVDPEDPCRTRISLLFVPISLIQF